MSDLGVVAFTAGWFAGLLQSNQSPLSVEEVGEVIVDLFDPEGFSFHRGEFS